jgi:hypothetical protein
VARLEAEWLFGCERTRDRLYAAPEEAKKTSLSHMEFGQIIPKLDRI